MSQPGFDLSEASKVIEKSGEGIPPLDKWNPDFCGDIDMCIARDGKWFYQGTIISRPAMVKLFSKVLWLEEGKYFLKTPVEKVGIEVEDAPFLMTEVQVQEGENGPEYQFVSTTGDKVVIGKEHSLWVEECSETSEPSPYVDVRFGMKGLLHRNVFYELVELAIEREIDNKQVLVIESQGVTFILGEVS
ncbi:DUF1285 domain-containing protein [Neptuniibacter sp. QD48_55]|uniref:DUF1285 domain-containing protein n=1 Tax=Neptuniibacter sp. QD48_55 TaxID=3398212 RepID=UPI0039F61BD7